ncbi:MAG: hypothetical protein J6Z41_08250 [Prevotella sp.]|nr:hypothetical protein [Prevotella sp.]
MKKISLLTLAFLTTMGLWAQSGTNSPYSQYGYGCLAEQPSGFNTAMNGLSQGFRLHNQVNYTNPASYSALDSLTFIFDVGASGWMSNYKEGGVKKNASSANFEYALGAFRVAKGVGVSFGLVPYSNVGYNYFNTQDVSEVENSTTYTNTYSGDGGLHEVFLGAAWQPVKYVSIGANIGYLWGDINRSIINSYSDAYVNTLSKTYYMEVNSYKLDLGAQFIVPVNRNSDITIGVTFSPKHKLKTDPECRVVSTNSSTGVSDTALYVLNDVLDLPASFAVGATYNHRNKLRLGFDYQLQKFGDIEMPQYSVVNNVPQYSLVKGLLNDRSRYTFGGEYCRKEDGRRFVDKVRYRFGASYATPYIKINGVDGPKEVSLSAGFGLPIINNYNNRSMLNISGQWTRRSATGMIRENEFRINIGLTFNEKWFQKFKVQ